MTIKRISEIERGRVNVTLDTVERLADALQVDAGSLLRFEVLAAPQNRRQEDAGRIVAAVTSALAAASPTKLRKLRVFLEEIL